MADQESNVIWRYRFPGATTSLQSAPVMTIPGQTAQLWGVDGRVDGILRCYLGNRRDTATTYANTSLGDFASVGVIRMETAKYVEFQKAAGSTDMVRGFFVVSATDSKLEFWYRITGDSESTIRRQDLTATLSYVNTETVDFAVRGPYVYYVSTGTNKNMTLSISGTTLAAVAFGPDTATPGNPALSFSGTGRIARDGSNYSVQYRFRDTTRGRYTKLSVPTEGSPGSAAGAFYLMRVNKGGNAPTGYDKFQIFSTRASGSTNVAAGGTKYKIFEGAASDWNASTVFDIAAASGGETSTQTMLTEASFPTQYAFDIIQDEITALGKACAVESFQDMTVALELDGSFWNVRWSSQYRLEPENFPSANTFRTTIPFTAASSCRLVVAGDFLFIVGGDVIYRMQKVGQVVGIVEILRGPRILHRNAIQVIGSSLYIATANGLLLVDARGGTASFVPGLEWLFNTRWNGALDTPGATIQLAFDSELGCLFLHHPSFHETACVWLTTGKLSLLGLQAFQMAVTGKNTVTGIGMRTHWLSQYRYVCSPNYALALATIYPATTAGLLLAADTCYYNATVSAVTGSPTPSISVSYTSTRPFGSGGTRMLVSGMYITFLSGNEAGNSYQIEDVGATHEILKISETSWRSGGPTAGDIVALDPVPFAVVGSPLWDAAGRLSTDVRKKVTHGTVTLVGSITATDHDTDPTFPLSSAYGMFKFGVMKANGSSSRGSAGTLFTPSATGHIRKGIELTYNSSADNWGVIENTNTGSYPNPAAWGASGAILLPFILCNSSALAFDLMEMVFKGTREATTKTG